MKLLLDKISSKSGYRWYILVLGTLTHILAVSMPRISTSVLFKEIAEELGLNLIQIGTVWGMIGLAGVFTGLIGGLLGDYFGVKRTLTVACFITGVSSALRGLSGGFFSLATTVFLLGILVSTIPNVVHKIAGIWFLGQRLVLANGILSIGMVIGSMAGAMISATVLSPLLGGWRNVFFLYGVAPVIISMLWFLTVREPEKLEPSGKDTSPVSFHQALSNVIQIKEVWILGLIMLGEMGAFQGLSGYLPLYLREIGWTPASADSTLALLTGTGIVSTIPMALLSDRLGGRKKSLIPPLFISAVSLALIPFARGSEILLLVTLIGIPQGGMMAILLTMVIELKEVGAKYAGTAMGLTYAITCLGNFLAPPIGNGLAEVNPSLPFIFWGALSAVALIGFFFVKEKGEKA